MREEINSLQTVKSRQIQRISELEDNLKKVKEELEKKSQVAQADEEVSIKFYLFFFSFFYLDV